MSASAGRPAKVLTPHVDWALARRILDEVHRVPRGRVATYGDIAARAGSRSPRLAGYVLAHLADGTIPWHRVVRADGRLAGSVAPAQIDRLRAENVDVVNGRVDLRRYRVSSTSAE